MKNTILPIMTTLALGLTSLPRPTLAWGPEGHEIVADIAAHYLTPAAKKEVKAILGDQKLGDYEIASWPDIIRGTQEYEAIYPKNGRWHYVDFDAFKKYGDELKLPEDGQDIVTQIGRWRDELASKDASPERKLDAVRFLVHFVGDIHQPLHCAYRYGDMGGNMIPVHSFHGSYYSFNADTPMDWAPNLHSTWDEYLVYELLGGLKPKAFARKLAKEITPEQSQYWLGSKIFDWAVNSYWLARKQAYHWTDGENLPFKWTGPGMDLTHENYIDSHLPIVREQLEKAGVRLAHLLNTALDPDYALPPKPVEPATAAPATPSKD